MRVCVFFCSAIPALKFTFFKEELFGLCPENSGAPRQLRFSYSTENSEEFLARLRRMRRLQVTLSMSRNTAKSQEDRGLQGFYSSLQI
jgi:hypothetical protein